MSTASARAHREQVRGHRRPVGPDLGRLVADRAVDRPFAVDAAHAAHVDELELLLGLDHVVRLEVAVHQPPVVQVPQRRQHLDRVRDRVRERHRAAVAPGVLQDLLERLAAHVLHHDVPGRLPRPPVRVLHEVIDPHDIRVFHLGEELALGDRGGHGIGVAGIEQALEHHPAVADVVVPGQVDPAEPAEGEAAEHLVLPRHQVARLQLRAEREPGAAVAAETLGQPRPAVLAAPDGLLAARAEAAALRDLRIGEDGAGRVAVGHRRDLHQPRAQPAPRRPPAGAPRSPGSPGAGGLAAAGRPGPRRSRSPGRRCRTPARIRSAPRPPGRRPGRRRCSNRPRSSRRSWCRCSWPPRSPRQPPRRAPRHRSARVLRRRRVGHRMCPASARSWPSTGRPSAVAAGPRSRTGRTPGAAWRSPGRRARR